MKRLFLLFLLLAFMGDAGAQSCVGEWLEAGNGPTQNYAGDGVLDDGESLYTTGVYTTNITISGTVLNTAGPVLSYGLYLCKFDAQRKLVFAKTIALSRRGFLRPYIAKSGDKIYVFGYNLYGDSLRINGTGYTTPAAYKTFALMQFDPGGNFLWQKVFSYKESGSGSSLGHGIAAIPTTIEQGPADFYIGGTFTDTMRIDTMLIGRPGSKTPSVFIAKMNTSGQVVWARWSTSDSMTYTHLTHLYIRPGGVVAGGAYHTRIRFGNDSAGSTNLSINHFLPFLVSFDSTGAVDWLFAGESKHGPGGGMSSPIDGVSDKGGNSYIIGSYYDSLYLGNYKLYGLRNRFMAKLSPTGQVVWAKSHNSLVNSYENASTIMLNHKGHLVVGGAFTDSTYFDTVKYVATGGGQDAYIGEYDTSGQLLRMDTYGSNGYDWVGFLLAHNNDSVVTGGYFGGATLSIGSHTITATNTIGGNTYWYDRCVAAKSNNVIGYQTSSDQLRVYPNPTGGELSIVFAQLVRTGGQMQVYTISGQSVLLQTIATGSDRTTCNLAMLPTGVYLLDCLVDGERYRQIVVRK